MEEITQWRAAIITLGWSLLCAVVIIGASLASEYWGMPDATMWIIALWWTGFSFAIVLGVRGRK